MKPQNGNKIQRPQRFRAVFSNTAPQKQRTKRAHSRVVVRKTREKIVKNDRRGEHKERPQPMALVSPAVSNALHLAMSRFCPNNYPGAIPSVNDINAPVATATLRMRSRFNTVANGSVYSLQLQLGNSPTNMIRYATTYAAGLVSAEAVAQATNLAALTANYALLNMVSAEVIIRQVTPSADISGSWCVANIPNANTLVGQSYTILAANSTASVGVFTDAAPAVRGILLPLDDSDYYMNAPTTNPPVGSGVLQFGIDTVGTAPTTLDVEFIINFAGIPTSAGSSIMATKVVVTDDGAFARAFDSLSSNIENGNRIITDPVQADREHAGWLKKAATFVTGTARDAVGLVKAVQGAIEIGSAIGVGAAALFGDPQMDMFLRLCAGMSMNPPKCFDRMKESLPSDFVQTIQKLFSYKYEIRGTHRCFDLRVRQHSEGEVKSIDDLDFIEVVESKDHSGLSKALAKVISCYRATARKPFPSGDPDPKQLAAFLAYADRLPFNDTWTTEIVALWHKTCAPPP